MTIKQFRDVVFGILGDGVSTDFLIDLSSGPISLIPEKSGSTACVTQPGFDFRVSPPTLFHASVSDPANPGSTVLYASLMRSILTVSLSAAPDDGINPAQINLRLTF